MTRQLSAASTASLRDHEPGPEIAATIAAALREFTQAWKTMASMPNADGAGLVASRLSDLTALLGKAERELVGAARADFGVPD